MRFKEGDAIIILDSGVSSQQKLVGKLVIIESVYETLYYVKEHSLGFTETEVRLATPLDKVML
jgi:hypothetical protein